MYRFNERARGTRARQATLVDRLQLLLCCVCALLPGGALLVSSQGATLSPVIRPLAGTLHIPLMILIFLLHPMALVIDGTQRRALAIGAQGDRGIRGILFPGGSEQLWKRLRRACCFGISYFGTAWCLLLILMIIGWIPWSDTFTAGAGTALAILVALHLVGLLLAGGVLLLGRLVDRWNRAPRW